MEELVSIIIPAYNVEKYIYRAIESSIQQTYQHVEVLIIDDGSNDKTWNIIQKYSIKDNKIRAYHQENKGVSSARNYALSLSRGKYVLFLDSDDWLEKHAVDMLVDLAKKSSEYLICCDRYFAFFDKNDFIYKKRQRAASSLKSIDLEKALVTTGTGEYNLQSSCYKLFVKELIVLNNIQFQTDLYHGEDGLFVFEYLLHTRGIIFSTEPLWNILERPGSTTTSSYNYKWLSMLDSVNRMIDISPDSFDIKYALTKYKAQRLMILIKTYCISNTNNKKEFDYIKEGLCQIIDSKYFKKFDEIIKLKVLLLKACPKIILKFIYSIKR